jgi:hypothetical protein
VPIDLDGHFVLDSLFFFGSLKLYFQINGLEDASAKDVKLNLTNDVLPVIDGSVFHNGWEDDTKPLGKEDTMLSENELVAYKHSKINTLDTIYANGRIDRRRLRREIDRRYTTGAFGEPAIDFSDKVFC